MQETEKIWMNGELVDWADAKVHVGAHGLHYGSGVFEGIRWYETEAGPAVFRLTDHLKRLENSARLLHMELPYSVDELRSATLELHRSASSRSASRSVRHSGSVIVVRCQLALKSEPAHGFSSPAAHRFRTARPK